jgi:DNA-binding NarL/FixJ family response regulator
VDRGGEQEPVRVIAQARTPTPRQLEVLRARCEAGSRKEAAAALGISPETVRWHLARLYERCGCVDDAQAAYRHHSELAAEPREAA